MSDNTLILEVECEKPFKVKSNMTPEEIKNQFIISSGKITSVAFSSLEELEEMHKTKYKQNL